MFLLNFVFIRHQLKNKLIKIKKIIHENENPIKIHNKITKKYFISLNTATNINIIKANPLNALK